MDSPQSSGHALMVTEDLAAHSFLVQNGDVLTDASSLKKVIEIDGPAVTVKKVLDPLRYGIFDGVDGVLRSAVEKIYWGNSTTSETDFVDSGVNVSEFRS